jgi:hypothetical protein
VKQERRFVRGGIAFIMFGFLLMSLQGVQESKDRAFQERVVMSQQGLRALTVAWEEHNLGTLALWTSEDGQLERVTNGTRADAELLKLYLNARPTEYKYDLKCLHLLGIVNDYLDNTAECATIESGENNVK